MKALLILIISLFYMDGVIRIRMQPEVPEELVKKGARIEKAGTGYAFAEGSSTAPDGRVFFTDQPNDRIYFWSEKEGIRLFLEGTGRSNGTCFDSAGNLVTCADLKNSLIRISSEGKITDVCTEGFEGKHFNGPNDLWIDAHGGIYFTDPYYHRDYWSEGHTQSLDVQGVYYLPPDGKLIRVAGDLQQPNGIAGTPDGKILYVADIKGRTTWRYRINEDGSLSDKTLFVTEGSDGMTIDSKGNVYLTSGKVLVFSKTGEKAGEIAVPENPSNVCFGGMKKDILFITARTSVYTLQMKVRGVE